MTQYTHPFKFPGKIFGHNSSRSLVAFISKFISQLHVGICRFLFIEYWGNTSPWIDSLGTDQKFSLSLDTEPGYFLYTQPNRLFHLQLVVGCSPSFTHSLTHSIHSFITWCFQVPTWPDQSDSMHEVWGRSHACSEFKQTIAGAVVQSPAMDSASKSGVEL